MQAAIDVKDPEFGVFVRLSAMTGARRSEMLALRWPDIDLERGVVTIGRGLVQGPDGLVEKDTKTHQTRRVALDVDAYVFATDVAGSTPWYPDSASRRFRKACACTWNSARVCGGFTQQ